MSKKSRQTNPVPSDSADIDTAAREPKERASDGGDRSPSLLPHERDEKSGRGSTQAPGSPAMRGRVAQAGHDVDRGVVDTERRGIPSTVPRGST